MATAVASNSRSDCKQDRNKDGSSRHENQNRQNEHTGSDDDIEGKARHSEARQTPSPIFLAAQRWMRQCCPVVVKSARLSVNCLAIEEANSPLGLMDKASDL